MNRNHPSFFNSNNELQQGITNQLLSSTSILNNFGFTFEVIPSLLRNQFMRGGMGNMMGTGAGPVGGSSTSTGR